MTVGPLNQLHVFLAVAQRRSFRAAAQDLGVSASAVSQSIRQLEETLRVVLVTRTTRSVSLTAAGTRLLESAGPPLAQVIAALDGAALEPGETVGRLRLSVPRAAIRHVIQPVLPAFRARHPGIEVEVVVEDRFVDIVAEGYDAGVRLSEAIEKDMVQVRLTDAFRFLIVGSPAYLAARGTPQRPEDLTGHECITFRSPSTGALYAFELERGRRNWRIAVRGGLLVNDTGLRIALAEAGMGLTYVPETSVTEQLQSGRLRIVLEPYAPMVPGFFLYFPSRTQRSPALRAFTEMAKAMAASP